MILNITALLGSYWYDNPATKNNGEFDCVICLPLAGKGTALQH